VQLLDLCFSPNIILVIKSGRMRLAEHVAYKGDRKGVYRVLVGKLEGKRPLGRPRYIWKDNIKNGSLRCRMGVWNGLI
jgi:hypothetical protein